VGFREKPPASATVSLPVKEDLRELSVAENRMRIGLGYLFDRALTTAPDKVAVIQDEILLTFRELDRRANRVGWALRRTDIGRADRVALLFDNDYRFLECYFGVLRLGAVVVPVNHRLSNEAAAYVLDHSDARLLVCSPNQVKRAVGLRRQVPGLQRIIGLDRTDPGVTAYEAWTGEESGDALNIQVSEEDIAIQSYTAGSTGKAKGCLLSHRGQLWNLDAVLALLTYSSEDRAVVATPVGHKNATMSIKRLLRVGGSVVLLRAFDPEGYLRAIERHRVTCATGVSAMYQMLIARKELFSRYDARSVRICCAASAQVPAGLQEALRTAFPNARLQEVYGATEAGYLVQPPDGSAGLVPVPESEVRIVREDGGECAVEETGEILFRNPGVAHGYHRNAELTRERIRNGWYHTGDLVRRTGDGRYFVVGRQDDMIVTGGENVYPKEIEDILLRHAEVANVCAVPVPHPLKGQVPVAFVVLRAAAAVTESELKEFFFANGAAYAHPRRVFLVPELPLSGSGKVDRTALRARAESAVRDSVWSRSGGN
jgi:long-chain acyl-CoA synthetase